MSSQNEEQVVVFQLNDQTYGIDIVSVREIIRMEEITKIPGAPDFMEGIIKLRGGVIPVIDLCRRFGLISGERTSQSRIIIVQVNNTTFGMIVDAVQEVLRIPSSSIEPPPPMAGGVNVSYLKGVALLEERLIILLDHNKILYDSEQEELQQLEKELNK
ncbi:purine-binding chemotaxis protein CheW [Desulfohalotomaculum tongense]|uniref:chemotaxis protein CheW n=1 Tax=Desulforadius tongensis TaxID=1216062 RepID=UPI00195D9076|nr:chemotaxis protein CheW [Desulforadius tongensis]MBM7856060.1 purine-binding chemotaxis protein CheW [Desulforadius tongensis]